MSFLGEDGLGEMFPHKGAGEARPRRVKRPVDGGGPGMDNGAPGAKMEPCGQVNLGPYILHVVDGGRWR